jgi:phosphoribosylaminoimidazole-succinocarboxamide synthase
MGKHSNTLSRTDYKFPGQTALYHGKVRDVYSIEDKVIVLVATDRISAFDAILPKDIPYKGQVLNQLADFFLSGSRKVAENWLLTSPDPNVSVGVKAKPFRLEVIVRACLAGSAWRDYKEGKRELSGVKVPDGLREYSKFPSGPIITPTTKNEDGHDESIDKEQIIATNFATDSEWAEIEQKSYDLFAHGQEVANKKGLILADTKYEFGMYDGRIIVIDEIHTPDSSRYFYLDSYENYIIDKTSEKPKHLSKEFVREWLAANGFSGQDGEEVPELTDEFAEMASKRYIELYEKMTGNVFVPAPTDNIEARIEQNVNEALKGLKNE